MTHQLPRCVRYITIFSNEPKQWGKIMSVLYLHYERYDLVSQNGRIYITAFHKYGTKIERHRANFNGIVPSKNIMEL